MDRAYHEDRSHIYRRWRNPSGCDKFYCLRRFSLWWKIKLWVRG